MMRKQINYFCSDSVLVSIFNLYFVNLCHGWWPWLANELGECWTSGIRHATTDRLFSALHCLCSCICGPVTAATRKECTLLLQRCIFSCSLSFHHFCIFLHSSGMCSCIQFWNWSIHPFQEPPSSFPGINLMEFRWLVTISNRHLLSFAFLLTAAEQQYQLFFWKAFEQRYVPGF